MTGFHYPSTRAVLTGNGNRSPVISGSGNRALEESIASEQLTMRHDGRCVSDHGGNNVVHDCCTRILYCASAYPSAIGDL